MIFLPNRRNIRHRRRPVTRIDVTRIGLALAQLKEARMLLRMAGAHHGATYVGRALKSVQGAYNHAEGMLACQDRGGRYGLEPETCPDCGELHCVCTTSDGADHVET